ncbi:MAG: RNA polymerase sigma factor [Sandaracinaceae bacterium]|nr:RNA polymerase sigma factor [Sandaracinaceae bacterium]
MVHSAMRAVAPGGVEPARESEERLDRCRAGISARGAICTTCTRRGSFRFIGRLGVPRADAPDVLQETFVVAFRRLGDFQPDRSAFGTWLFGIALRVARNHQRASLRARLKVLAASLIGRAPVPDPSQHAESSAAARELTWILQRMPQKQREVFILYEIEGFEGAQIARIVGCPEGTARSRLRLARAQFERLRETYERGGGP